MQKYSKTVEQRRNLSRLTIHYAQSRVTSSESHGGFDNDPVTMNHVLRRVLGKKPGPEFTESSLKY